MPVSDPIERSSETLIHCGGTADITLSLDAWSNISKNPMEIVLVMDRSGSMSGSFVEKITVSAKNFIDAIVGERDSAAGERFKNVSKMALISFSGEVTVDVPFTEKAHDLKVGIDRLVYDGYTNHEEAFRTSFKLFDMDNDKHKAIVMFTDGDTTIGVADKIVKDIKAAGIEIYCIGLEGYAAQLNEWASLPLENHGFYSRNIDGLAEKFENAAKEILKAGTENAVVEKP